MDECQAVFARLNGLFEIDEVYFRWCPHIQPRLEEQMKPMHTVAHVAACGGSRPAGKRADQHSGGCERPCAARPDWCLPPLGWTGSSKISGRHTVAPGPLSPASEKQKQENIIRHQDNCRDSLKTDPRRLTDVRIILLCNHSAGLQNTGMGLI